MQMREMMTTSKKTNKGVRDWISVAFDDFDAPASLKSSGSQVGRTRKRIRDDVDDVSSQPKTAARLAQVFGQNKKQDHNQLWVDKHTPKTKDDIVVHKKKVEEVETWLLSNLSSVSKRGCGIALLTGPAGTGKTATMRVLAEEQRLDLQEWSNSSTTSVGEWQQNDSESFSDRRSYGVWNESQSTQFKDFLLRADRYQSLQLTGDCRTKKVILVEEFPNQFYRETRQFHDIIRNYKRCSQTPLVFIVSDSAGGDSNARRLFPPDVQAELGIINISFNPVGAMMMTKVLQKIASSESSQGSQLTKADLEPLVTGSGGDIRAAINALQFAGRSRYPTAKSSKSTRGRSTKSNKNKEKSTKNDDSLAIGGRDNSLFLFRALGKILYCKRGDPKDFPAESPLPERYSEHARAPLLVDPEDVVEKSNISGAYFQAYLHQNYLDFFQNLDDVLPATDYMSDADFLSADWVSRIAMQEYSASVATRGLMHCNNISSGGQSGRGWKPLHKPAWFTAMKNCRENRAATQDLFRGQTWSPIDLNTQLLPYMATIKSAATTAAQRDIIQRVGRIQRQYGFRGGGERLDEKDVDLSEDEDEEAVAKSNQAPSSAHLDTTIIEKPQIDDDDFVIEDFED